MKSVIMTFHKGVKQQQSCYMFSNASLFFMVCRVCLCLLCVEVVGRWAGHGCLKGAEIGKFKRGQTKSINLMNQNERERERERERKQFWKLKKLAA